MPKPKISIIVSVCDRYEHLALMVSALERANKRCALQLIAVDHESKDGDVSALLKVSMLKTRFLNRPRPFRRAAGLNAGFRLATGRVVFFTDADIIHPPDLVDVLLSTVKAGVCYFPICQNLRKEADLVAAIKGTVLPEWLVPRLRKKGFGICGFWHKDFAKILWDERFRSWGKEDNDLRGRTVRKHKLKLVRKPLPGLHHMWHDTSLKYRNKNY